jgi:hypothetical protein
MTRYFHIVPGHVYRIIPLIMDNLVLLKAATQSYDSSYPSSFKSKNICFRVLLYFRDLNASVLGQAKSLAVNSSSELGYSLVRVY